MLECAKRDWGIDMPGSFMVGDSERDIVAGRAAGATGIMIGSARGGLPASTLRAPNLISAARLIFGTNETVAEPS